MILTSDFLTVWRKLGYDRTAIVGPTNLSFTLYARGRNAEEIEYVGQTIDFARRSFEHDLDTHNVHLQALPYPTISFALGTYPSLDAVVLAEQRAVAIAKALCSSQKNAQGQALGNVGNACRGGTWSGKEELAKTLYVSAQTDPDRARAERAKATCKQLVHCIMPAGQHTMKLLALHETETDSLIFFEDSNGWLYFNKCPKNIPAYAARNNSRRAIWRTYEPLVGTNVLVEAFHVTPKLLQMNVLGPSSAELVDGRQAMLADCIRRFREWTDPRAAVRQAALSHLRS